MFSVKRLRSNRHHEHRVIDDILTRLWRFQVKIVCDKERSRRSKGFGFIELAKHQDALTVLRHLNNNPDTAGGKQKRPIVEFAVENVLKLRRLQHSMQGGAAATGGKMSQPSKAAKADAKDEADHAPKPLSRRQKQALADKQQHQAKMGIAAPSPAHDPATSPKRGSKRQDTKRIIRVADEEQTDRLASGGEQATRDRGSKRKRQEKKDKDNKEERDFDSIVNSYKRTLL